MLMALCGFDDGHAISVLRGFAVSGRRESAVSGDRSERWGSPEPLGRKRSTVLERGLMLRRRRTRALQVARLLIQIERAAARPWEPQPRTRSSLAGRAS
jgi:hypothetical protein